jgi:hypothetical protein
MPDGVARDPRIACKRAAVYAAGSTTAWMILGADHFMRKVRGIGLQELYMLGNGRWRLVNDKSAETFPTKDDAMLIAEAIAALGEVNACDN